MTLFQQGHTLHCMRNLSLAYTKEHIGCVCILIRPYTQDIFYNAWRICSGVNTFPGNSISYDLTYLNSDLQVCFGCMQCGASCCVEQQLNRLVDSTCKQWKRERKQGPRPVRWAIHTDKVREWTFWESFGGGENSRENKTHRSHTQCVYHYLTFLPLPHSLFFRPPFEKFN